MTIAPSPYEIGKTYRTVGGDCVTLVKTAQEDSSYEAMACLDGIHRYTRRDFGRVTGTDHNNPDPRNLIYPPEAVEHIW